MLNSSRLELGMTMNITKDVRNRLKLQFKNF